MNTIIEIILKLFTRLKYDKKKFVIIIGSSILGYFILERIEFRKIILLILIIICVSLYFLKDDYLDEIKNNKEEFKNKMMNRGQTKTEKKVDIKNILNDFKVKNPKFNDKIFKLNELEKYLEDLEDFIKVNYKEIIFSYGETSKKNNNLDLYHNIKLKLKDYLNQVEILITNEYYLDKSFLKLLAIKKDIIHLIHSMYFKINYIYDDKVNQFIKKLEDIFKNIETQLKIKINKDFIKEPNSYKGMINMDSNTPEDYDPQDNLHLINITNKNI